MIVPATLLIEMEIEFIEWIVARILGHHPILLVRSIDGEAVEGEADQR
jgi:hypothetical protein